MVGPEVGDLTAKAEAYYPESRAQHGKHRACKTRWCPLVDVNGNKTTVQCSPNGGGANYGFPNVLDPEYYANNCPYNGQPCLFNIERDPCEYRDVKEEEVAMYHHMYYLLLSYDETMVTPLIALYPPNGTAADPQRLDGFWGPWVNGRNHKYDL